MAKEAYRVLWTQTAEQDLRKIIGYIASDSEIQARKVYRDIKQQAAALQHMPLRGRVVPELQYYGIAIYRELISSPWRIIYRVEGVTLRVLAVIDGRRNIEDVLFDRLI